MTHFFTNEAGDIIYENDNIMSGETAEDCCCGQCCEVEDCDVPGVPLLIECVPGLMVGQAIQDGDKCYVVTAVDVACDGEQIKPADPETCDDCDDCPCVCKDCVQVSVCGEATEYEIPCEDLPGLPVVGDAVETDGLCLEVTAVNQPCGAKNPLPLGEIPRGICAGGCNDCPCVDCCTAEECDDPQYLIEFPCLKDTPLNDAVEYEDGCFKVTASEVPCGSSGGESRNPPPRICPSCQNCPCGSCGDGCNDCKDSPNQLTLIYATPTGSSWCPGVDDCEGLAGPAVFPTCGGTISIRDCGGDPQSYSGVTVNAAVSCITTGKIVVSAGFNFGGLQFGLNRPGGITTYRELYNKDGICKGAYEVPLDTHFVEGGGCQYYDNPPPTVTIIVQ